MCVTVWVLRYKNKKNGDRGTIVFTATLSTIFSLSLENEQADAGPDGRTRLARLNSQARTGTDSKIFIFSVQLTTSSTGNLTRG